MGVGAFFIGIYYFSFQNYDADLKLDVFYKKIEFFPCVFDFSGDLKVEIEKNREKDFCGCFSLLRNVCTSNINRFLFQKINF